MKFTNQELMQMASPACPVCNGKSFARAGDTYSGRCVECKTVVESFGVVPQLAAQLLAERKTSKPETIMSNKTYSRIQTIGPWIAGITALLGMASLFLL